ncbi:hypothetical protein [Demequina sp. NBRC 110053]|uniref:hypothetical protein n=1 Tax=Demequina sp. NBRC 110053 TaxID=1570342 RepID=UPI000A072BE0|nr:hypothetical protein [Demequina sp. NBRC 110053]
MSALPDGEVQYWNSRSAAIRTIVKGIAMATLGLAVIAIMIFWSDGINVVLRIVFGLIMAIPLFRGLGLLSSGISMTTADGKLAVAVSDEGIRAPGVGLTRWDHIERLQVYSGHRSASWRSVLGGLISKDGDLRLVVTRKDDPAKPQPEIARSFATAFESDLAGRDGEFAELARLVHGAAAKRGIPMTVLAAGRPWVAEDLGIPAAQ